MSVSADIETRYRTNVVTVPIQCVTRRYVADTATNTAIPSNSPAATNVSVAADPPAPLKQVDVVFAINGDHVKVVPVKMGVEDDTYLEITDGLKDGDDIVSGNSRAIGKDLDDGSKIILSTSNSVVQGAK
jgi:HlyD family secretion protein